MYPFFIDLFNNGAIYVYIGSDTKKVFEFFRKQNAPVKDGYNLSARELQILELLVKGNSYKMIADKASISSDTVKKHLQNIYRKLHVSCSTEAVAKALRQKIIL